MGFGKTFARWLVTRVSDRDPWRRFEAALPEGAFGGRERTPALALHFSSKVAVASLEQVCDWLAGCEKLESPDPRFVNANLAVLAEALETERRGTCKAHAAWAFSKVAHLGLNPLLVIGRLLSSGNADYHAWLVIESHGQEVLFETMAADPRDMTRPLEEAKVGYVPRFAGDAAGRTFIYPDQLHAQLA